MGIRPAFLDILEDGLKVASSNFHSDFTNENIVLKEIVYIKQRHAQQNVKDKILPVT